MMDQDVIIERLLNAFDDVEDVMKIRSDDFQDERDVNMLVIGCNSVDQINFGLPDYRFNITILVDTLIDQDEEGELHKATCKAVEEVLEPYTSHLNSLADLFGDLPVVGLIFRGKKIASTEASFRTSYDVEIITSEEES